VTQVPVNRDALAALIQRAWDLFVCLADESGYEIVDLLPESELVQLACQAGLPIPGPMAPGTVPPAPPPYLGRLTSPTYRELDGRLRCVECGKVVYGNSAQAKEAASRITGARQAMRWYIGECGHYHLSRVKERRT